MNPARCRSLVSIGSGAPLPRALRFATPPAWSPGEGAPQREVVQDLITLKEVLGLDYFPQESDSERPPQGPDAAWTDPFSVAGSGFT